jgi:outer membrane lipoprotein SlyB
MTKQITLKEALELASFYHSDDCGWRIRDVYGVVGGNVCGDVRGSVCGAVGGGIGGNVYGNVKGNVCGDVTGDVFGNVGGDVKGTIRGRSWKSVESPKDKLQRLITESGNQELIDTFNQLEDN